MINEYTAIPNLTREMCGETEDVTYDEDGNELCFSCIFERETERMFGEE